MFKDEYNKDDTNRNRIASQDTKMIKRKSPISELSEELRRNCVHAESMPSLRIEGLGDSRRAAVGT